MGHAFQQTIMDVLVRYHRMNGEETLWQPGLDHAGIATQILVERELEQQGISCHHLDRDSFVAKVWEWKERSGGTIVNQMKRLGASCDWSRERFTMDEKSSKNVRDIFVKLYREGLIYRGQRLVNWDPSLQTAVSDLEVVTEEEEGFLWCIHYPQEDGTPGLVVATTRPETLFGDVAVVMHPDDERYSHFVGRFLRVPLAERLIPVIADVSVAQDFGTSCVKVTPAHDFNDYEIGKRHALPMLNILTQGGLLNEKVPEKYRGLSVLEARQAVIQDLEESGVLKAKKNHRMMVPRCDRTGTVIQPFLTDQWFVDMKPLAEDALACVQRGDIRFIPENWRVTYEQWLENIQDWCVSRQLWWGHRIPAWYTEDDRIFVAHSREEAASLAHCDPDQLRQDDDVLDTWFSSSFWCFTTLGWPDLTRDMERFLPSSVLVTGFDIIFFWVARMIMMTRHMTGKNPFRDVYINPIVRDIHGQKMSKSKGNVIDPIDLMDGIGLDDLIQKRTRHLMNPKQSLEIAEHTRRDYPQGFLAFGADALRFTFASLATQSRYTGFDVKKIEGYRNFCNKLWNASRFVFMNVEHCEIDDDFHGLSWIDCWILSRLNICIKSVRLAMSTYRFDFAAQALYDFVWNHYCDWYLELAKVQMQKGTPKEAAVCRRVLIHVLEHVLRLLHPFMPFMTEELWQHIKLYAKLEHQEASIMLAHYPEPEEDKRWVNRDIESKMIVLQNIIGTVRELRTQIGLPPSAKVDLIVQNVDGNYLPEDHGQILEFLAKVKKLLNVAVLPEKEGSPVAVCGVYTLMLDVVVNPSVELARLEKTLQKLESEQEKIGQRLSKKGYVDKAPKHLVSRDQQQLEELKKKIVQLYMQKSKLVL